MIRPRAPQAPKLSKWKTWKVFVDNREANKVSHETFVQVESLKEQLWEIDTSNRNNLVFYGIKEDSGAPEAAIKDVIRRFDL